MVQDHITLYLPTSQQRIETEDGPVEHIVLLLDGIANLAVQYPDKRVVYEFSNGGYTKRSIDPRSRRGPMIEDQQPMPEGLSKTVIELLQERRGLLARFNLAMGRSREQVHLLDDYIAERQDHLSDS